MIIRKKMILPTLLLSILMLVSCQEKTPAFHSADEQKADSLLKLMTLEEKLGQMTQMCFSTITLDGSKSLDLNVDNFQDAVLNQHIGSFLSGSDSAARWVEFITSIQKLAIEETRLGIPLLIGIDHVHGANYVFEGTILPHNLTLGCSFDPEVARMAAYVTASETAPLGLHWNFAPVLDIGKNAYWPRLYETFSEDPLVTGRMGASFIEQYENMPSIDPVQLAACGKHFIGYSDPKYGYDRSPAEIPMQVLHEYFVPPFQQAIDAGVKTIMVNSGEVNGVPVHRSAFLLDTLLRQELGFEGVILTDIKDIERLVHMHKNAPDFKTGTLRCIEAGIDMYMACNAYTFIDVMQELVEEGKITEARIDESVRRILKLKFELGLFENPYPDTTQLHKIGSKENRDKAQEMAEKSIVLLQNDGALPLQPTQRILVTGFAAHSKKMINGAWTYDWQGIEEAHQPADMNTLYEVFSQQLGADQVIYHEAKGIDSAEEEKRFTQACQDADVLVITIGEEPYSEFEGNLPDLNLESSQLRLLDAAIATGKPVVAVIIAGRPRVFTQQADQCQAILFAGHPGIRGTDALVNIMTGKVNPSGKLSFSYPKYPGHVIPYYIKHAEYSRYWKHMPARPFLFPFGHGLSYNEFTYSNLTLSDTVIRTKDQTIIATVEIQNTGTGEADEIALWFIHDKVGETITRPMKKLQHFERLTIPGGIKQKASFTIKPLEDLVYPDARGKTILEDGEFDISIGGQRATFTLSTQKQERK